jgi:hypothetical protein
MLCLAGSGSASQTNAGESGAVAAEFSYKFENPRFYEPLIEIAIAADGSAILRFKRGESDEVLDRKFKALPQTVDRIRQLYESAHFIESQEDYQDKKDFSHLGWVSLTARLGERSRSVRFNYTSRPEIKELAEIFRGLATQEMHLFDIDTAQRYQPLDLPKRLEVLENDLRNGRVAEPEQLLAILKEISGDDTQPLIARNQATRITDNIKKGKFKTPIKNGSR